MAGVDQDLPATASSTRACSTSTGAGQHRSIERDAARHATLDIFGLQRKQCTEVPVVVPATSYSAAGSMSDPPFFSRSFRHFSTIRTYTHEVLPVGHIWTTSSTLGSGRRVERATPSSILHRRDGETGVARGTAVAAASGRPRPHRGQHRRHRPTSDGRQPHHDSAGRPSHARRAIPSASAFQASSSRPFKVRPCRCRLLVQQEIGNRTSGHMVRLHAPPLFRPFKKSLRASCESGWMAVVPCIHAPCRHDPPFGLVLMESETRRRLTLGAAVGRVPPRERLPDRQQLRLLQEWQRW